MAASDDLVPIGHGTAIIDQRDRAGRRRGIDDEGEGHDRHASEGWHLQLSKDSSLRWSDGLRQSTRLNLSKSGRGLRSKIVAGSPWPSVAMKFAFTRSEEHTSELQSLMRISYAVFCLKKKKTKQIKTS